MADVLWHSEVAALGTQHSSSSPSVASAETLTGQRDLNEKVYGKKRVLSAFIRKEFGRKKPDELRISNYLLFSQQSLSSESQRWHVRIRQQNVILTAPNC